MLLINIYTAYLIISVLLCDVAAVIAVDYDWKDSNPCSREYATWATALFATNDLICNVVSIVLFAIPLCKMTSVLKRLDEQANEEQQRKLRYLTKKTSILAIIAVASSVYFIMMLAVINTAVLWLGIDSTITITCIILLFKRNDIIFDCCCGCCMCSLRRELNNNEKRSRCKLGCDTLLLLSSKKALSKETEKQIAVGSAEKETTVVTQTKTHTQTETATVTQTIPTITKVTSHSHPNDVENNSIIVKPLTNVV